jgi:hypothetical protein
MVSMTPQTKPRMTPLPPKDVIPNLLRVSRPDDTLNRPGSRDCSGYWVTASVAVVV